MLWLSPATSRHQDADNAYCKEKKRKRKDYTCWHQFDEKPLIYRAVQVNNACCKEIKI